MIFLCFTTSAGKAGELIDRGDNTYGGKFVINPSGGLISKGHPLGATGKKRPDQGPKAFTANKVYFYSEPQMNGNNYNVQKIKLCLL